MSTTGKVTWLGNTLVGKTCLNNRIIFGNYSDTNSTIGLASYDFEYNYQGNTINLLFFDTAGQERYDGLHPMYIRGSCVVCIVSDKDDINSYSKWINMTKECEDTARIILIRSKVDLSSDYDRTINEVEFDDQKYPLIYTSSKTGEGIEELKSKIVQTAVENTAFVALPPSPPLKDGQKCNC